ncbi:CHAT domain-containing protein [Microtetraspora malaysiensis]|uniref:CHAT domain-containing protein n=1 Tax=Microtetraspora malaysiensis TaxID=161358 RepID=UPI003D8DC558
MFRSRKRKISRYRDLVSRFPKPYRSPLLAILDSGAGPDFDALIAIFERRPVTISITENAAMLVQLNAILGGSPVIHLRFEAPTEDSGDAELVIEAEQTFAEYERTGHLPLLDEAAELFGQVLRGNPPPALRSAAESGIGKTKWSRFERFGGGDVHDLDEAIDLLRAALDHAPPDDPNMGVFHNNLAGVLEARWRSTGSLANLEEAIGETRAAVGMTLPSDPRYGSRVSALGTCLFSLAFQLNDSSALHESIELLKRALGLPLSETSATKANLAEALRIRHLWASDGDPAAIDEAVLLTEQALAENEQIPLRPRFQASLGTMLLARYHLHGDANDLERALDNLRRAVAATPERHPNRAERLNARAEAIHLHVRLRLGLTDPSALPPGDLSRAEQRALRNVVRAAEEAAEATPLGHVLHAASHLRLGWVYALTYALLDDPRVGLKARSTLARLIDEDGIPRLYQAQAAWMLVALHLSDKSGRFDYQEISPIRLFAFALRHVPHLASRALPQADRERHLAMFAGLAHDTAAYALGDAHSTPEEALSWLEHGRGVIHSQLLDNRTDMSELRAVRPDLAQEFEDLGRRFESPERVAFTPAHPDEPGLVGQDRHVLASRWDELIEQIREVPGMQGFLQPAPPAELLSATGEGPVVVVNVSWLRCDAIILQDGGARTVPLPGLDHEDLAVRADAFAADLRRAGDSMLTMQEQRTAQGGIVEALGWLWERVTEPILDELGFGPSTGEPAPRLWWVPTGRLTSFPLHAAGLAGVPGAHVLDRVVSSYAPTVRELSHARSRPTGSVSGRGALVVGVSRTPGLGDLPRVPEEVAAVATRAAEARVLMADDARREAVLRELPRYGWAHFACHAISPEEAGAGAHLVLADHEEHPLRMEDLVRLRLDRAELAFLSACDTTRARGQLADEALHVTGALHIAGYRQVVGTLWQVDDEAALQVADRFSKQVTAGAQPARALHDAVLALRDAFPRTPTLWGAHVHIGI